MVNDEKKTGHGIAKKLRTVSTGFWFGQLKYNNEKKQTQE
jgi:hypothetical protein